MTVSTISRLLLSALPIAFIAGSASLCAAQDQPAAPTIADGYVTKGKSSGLPLPRFVSLKSGRVNSRVGPGVTYGVDWLYTKSGLPMEITQEFDNWRRVRDSDGAEGWVNQTLLSGKRTAIVTPWQKGKKVQISVLARPEQGAATVAYVEPGVIGQIKNCDGQWCEMVFAGHEGYVTQKLLWGAYPGEAVNE